MEQITLVEISQQLAAMKKLIIGMQEYLEDSFLSAEDEIALEEAREEHKKGKTISLEDLKKELRNG